jgi:23S rRNA pseudouridine1911/1915/1917 synthase
VVVGPARPARPAAGDAASGVAQEVPEALFGDRLDAVVREVLGVSWNAARSYVETGKITVNDTVVTNILARVKIGSKITFTANARRPRPDTDLPEGAIIHVDAHVVVVRKPAGISTIPFDDNETGTLDERVRAFLAKKHGERGRPSLGVVHRIDKETSGLVVFTRTWLAKESLTQQFREHSVRRRYMAIVHGHPRAMTYKSHLVENRGDGLRGSVEVNRLKSKEGSQLAITHLKIEEELPGAALVACTLETGRTHQIRVHLSEAGHPLVGERVYIRNYKEPRIFAPRLMLHATELGFVHPKTEQLMVFTDPMPEDMRTLLQELRSKK